MKATEKCISFPRTLVAKFQKRTSHSRTCTEDGRQQEMGMTCPKDVTSIVR